MQLSEQKIWTLKKLGIPIWQRRDNAAPQASAELSQHAECVSIDSETVQVSLHPNTDLLICCQATQSPAEQQLMANIYKTLAELSLRIEKCDTAVMQSLSANQPLPPQVLIFGDPSEDLLADLHNHCSVLPSPADLIKQPARKADVWSVICQLQQLR
ncbi:MAG: DNA polymerase III subunit psi [Methylophaga sp.]|nr:DNA polymerase III subunit psi [Methylophaga sp.]